MLLAEPRFIDASAFASARSFRRFFFRPCDTLAFAFPPPGCIFATPRFVIAFTPPIAFFQRPDFAIVDIATPRLRYFACRRFRFSAAGAFTLFSATPVLSPLPAVDAMFRFSAAGCRFRRHGWLAATMQPFSPPLLHFAQKPRFIAASPTPPLPVYIFSLPFSSAASFSRWLHFTLLAIFNRFFGQPLMLAIFRFITADIFALPPAGFTLRRFFQLLPLRFAIAMRFFQRRQPLDAAAAGHCRLPISFSFQRHLRQRRLTFSPTLIASADCRFFAIRQRRCRRRFARFQAAAFRRIVCFASFFHSRHFDTLIFLSIFRRPLRDTIFFFTSIFR